MTTPPPNPHDKSPVRGSSTPPLPHARPPAILCTAFEPSGDDHAAALIQELRRRHPTSADLEIFAWGGPKMAAAGATVVERTGDDAVMGLPGIKKIREHQKINERIAHWLAAHHIDLHIPVDSPAANFPICEMTKARGTRIAHLVAPQVWAWGPWRIRKLRRLTDHLLCFLPFEEQYFTTRNVPATFVGHVLFDEPTETIRLDAIAAGYPAGKPRLAIMPGSRPAELEKNFPVQLDVFRRLKAEIPALCGMVAATKPAVADRLRGMAAHRGGWPDGLSMDHGNTDAIVRWCDAALVVSGTVTLQIAKQLKPMVILYAGNRFAFRLLRGVVLTTEHFTLPNLIAGRRAVPEYVPYGSDRFDSVLRHTRELLTDPAAAAAQRASLQQIVDAFAGRHAAAAAADRVDAMLGFAH